MPDFNSNIPPFFMPERPEAGAPASLPDPEAQHARALRLKPGDEVLLLDGGGARTTAVVEQLDRKKAALRIGETVLDGGESGPYIVVAVGILSDRARFEWLVEKAVELGAREIIPLVTERSEGRIHMERAQRVAVAALKQSQRSYLPIIAGPALLASVADMSVTTGYVCHEAAAPGDTLAGFLRSRPAAGSILLLIGPEGGFS